MMDDVLTIAPACMNCVKGGTCCKTEYDFKNGCPFYENHEAMARRGSICSAETCLWFDPSGHCSTWLEHD